MANIKKAQETKENDIEMYSRWYFEELIDNGYIKRIDRESERIQVVEDLYHLRTKYYKTKNNEAEQYRIKQGRTYTYDYRVVWNEKALNIFTEIYQKDVPFKFGHPDFVSHMVNDEIVSYIDVKPHSNVMRKGNGGGMSSYYNFPWIQWILLATRGLFINKMIPIPMAGGGSSTALFVKTFTPARYFLTDGGKQARKRSFVWTPLKSHIKRKERIINDILKSEAKKKGDAGQQNLF